MHLLKKQIMATGMILLMAMPLFFSTASLIKQKWIQYQHEIMRESLSMQTLTIQNEDLHWVKPGKEIFLHGKLFDVKSIRSIDGAVVVTGFFDEKETGLVRQMNRISETQSGNQHSLNSIAAKFLLLPVYSDYKETEDSRLVRILAVTYPTYSAPIPDKYARTILQPPKA